MALQLPTAQTLSRVAGPWRCDSLNLQISGNTGSIASLLIELFPDLPREDTTAFLSAFVEHDFQALKKLESGAADTMFYAEMRRFLGFETDRAPLMHGARSASAALVMLPFLVRDVLLSLVNGPPAPSRPRADQRISITAPLNKKLIQRCDWRALLSKAAAVHKKFQQTAKANPKQTYVTTFLAASFTQAGARPGTTAQDNMHAAAYPMGVYLTGELLLTQESVCNYASKAARAWGIDLTPVEAAAHVGEVDLRRAMTPLYIALAHSPLALLDDGVSYSAGSWARGHEWFVLWRAAGNERYLNPQHPLARVENVLWGLLFRIAHHALTPEAAYNAFFADPTVQEVLAQSVDPTYADALYYNNDPR
ncbi:hypothetical protein C8R44DRAFT_896074 [Mycena epipterygia]|nr:hypothetical protein C8R44DRAFT_896074 [Mycena epipterygia]